MNNTKVNNFVYKNDRLVGTHTPNKINVMRLQLELGRCKVIHMNGCTSRLFVQVNS